MTRTERIAFPAILILASTAYIASLLMPNETFSTHWMVREDGALEWLTVFSLSSCAVLCWYRCWHLQAHATRTFLACTATYGCVFLFGTGEEISWGQRIFRIETPEFLLEANAQKETNLHNLVIAGVSINKLIFGKILGAGLGLFLVIMPIVHQLSVPVRRILNRFAVPVPRLQHTLAILAAVLLVETSKASKRGEITEFALTSLVFLLLLNPLNLSSFTKPPVKKPTEEPARQLARRMAA